MLICFIVIQYVEVGQFGILLMKKILRNTNVIMTYKRRFDIIITFVCCCVFAG